MADYDLVNFQEEILLNIREIEHKVMDQLNAKIAETTKENEKFNEKINTINANQKLLIESIAENNIKLEKISNLEKFKLKTDEKIIAHEIKISNFSYELKKIKTQYDKLFIENFNVPGFIGQSCQYKNMSEYLSVNIIEFSKFKSEKEQLKKDTKELKLKMESLTKTIISMNDKSVEKCNEYTDNLIKSLKILMGMKFKELSKKNNDFDSQLSKMQYNVEEQLTLMKKELEKITKMKNNLSSLMDTKIEEPIIKDFNTKLTSNIEEVSLCRKEVKNLEQTVKKLNKNISDVKYNIRNIKNEKNNLNLDNYLQTETVNSNNINNNKKYNNNMNFSSDLTNLISAKNDNTSSNPVIGNLLQGLNNISDCEKSNVNEKSENIYKNKTKRIISSNIINTKPIKLKKKIELNTDILSSKKINNTTNSESDKADTNLYDKKDRLIQIIDNPKKVKENYNSLLYNKELEEENEADFKLINLKLDKKSGTKNNDYRSRCAIIFDRKLNNKDFSLNFTNDEINIVIPKEGKSAWKTHFFSESARRIRENLKKNCNNFNRKIKCRNYPKINNEGLIKKIKTKEPSKSGNIRYHTVYKS